MYVCVCVCVYIEKVKRKKNMCDGLFANAFRLQSFFNAKVFYRNYFIMMNNYN